MKKLFFYCFLFSFLTQVSAQDVAIGEWRPHLSYKSAVSVAEGNAKVYCATTGGLFVYNTGDNSLERLSTVNGLSDVEANVLGFNSFNNKLFVAYDNSNIDVIDGETIINLSDIKRKSIVGNKSINNVHFINEYAYLACGFGIVRVDMNKYEVKDTYFIGANGASLNVLDVSSDDDFLYAATDSGVFKASINSANLSNFTSWSLMLGLPTGIFNLISIIEGKIITNYSSFLLDGSSGKDTLFVYNSGAWNYFGTSGPAVKSVENFNDKLIVTFDSLISIYDTNLSLVSSYAEYFGSNVAAKHAVMDKNNGLWIADSEYGLISIGVNGSVEQRFPNGPNSENVAAMSIVDDELWVAPGGGNGSFYNDGIYRYDGEEWKRIYGNRPSVVNFDSIYDIMNVIINPDNVHSAYATWGDGLIEFKDNVPVKLYDESSSTLEGLTIVGYDPIWVYGMAFDSDGNFWVGNSGVPNCLSYKNTNGDWESLDFSSILGNAPLLKQLLIDENNQKWMIKDLDGIVVYDGGIDAPTSENTKKIGKDVGTGSLPSLIIHCMAEDNEGKIWVGTDKGIAVFHSPSSMFSDQNFDAQQILLEQDGNFQLLLETEAVQSIAVDGANRKWIATKTAGVFLMSADGTEEIYHFEKKNSPLLSDDVKDMVINKKSGEVYFATSKGIISYRGTATGGLDDFTDVYSFPNPVQHDYNGPIAIKGLMENSTVKITDISGSILYETISEGGQAIWNGKTFNGERVSSGVYMVFCTSEDGNSKIATKILFIN